MNKNINKNQTSTSSEQASSGQKAAIIKALADTRARWKALTNPHVSRSENEAMKTGFKIGALSFLWMIESQIPDHEAWMRPGLKESELTKNSNIADHIMITRETLELN